MAYDPFGSHRFKIPLNDVNLTFCSGKIYGLQGPNGSGKTMLMRLVSGLIRPTSGEVWIDGQRLGRDIDFPASVGLLIENPGFLPNHTGLKNLELLAKLQNRVNSADIRKTIKDVGLNPDDKRKYRKYSLGMKQRLGIAAAIMEKPELILLDEPTNALDYEGVEQICALIRQEQERGALVIMTCHDGAILERMSDEIYTVYEGRVEKRFSSVKPSQAMRAADREPAGGEIPVELVCRQPLDDFPQRAGVSRTNRLALNIDRTVWRVY